MKEGTAIAPVQRLLPADWAVRWNATVTGADKMADGKTVFENIFGEKHDGPYITAKDKSRIHEFLGHVLRVGEGGWSEELTIAEYEDCKNQKPQKSTSYFSQKKIFVKEDYEFPCANGILRLPSRPRQSSTAEGNLEREDDVEFEDGDKKGKQNRIFVVQEWRISLSTS